MLKKPFYGFNRGFFEDKLVVLASVAVTVGAEPRVEDEIPPGKYLIEKAKAIFERFLIF